MNEQTEKEHIKELIAFWPNEKFLVELTARQREAMLGSKLDDAADNFKRDASRIVDMCDCRGANIFEFGALPINNKHDPDAAFRMVRTRATKPGTCDFCKHTTYQVRESTIRDGKLVRELNEAAKKPMRSASVDEYLGRVYGHLKVTKTFIDKSNSKPGTKGVRMLTVECVCGNNQDMKVTRFGKAKSCGCRAYQDHGNKNKRRKAKGE